ncbi:MAG: UDP-glucose/GDP-mannose dehydrogenase family protein [Candidatus Delongbacteria bacterium]|nr:UDP-glucose/GDP-mannose dehydrogenase family protein [Candidatus Delongbacteria bacterium]
MKLAIVGTGYVGLVAGTCFAEVGNTVTCIDTDEGKIARLNRGDLPIYEPGLQEILEKSVRNERLFFTSSYERAIPEADVVFIAVGTPPDEDGSADLQHVLAAARMIGEQLKDYTVIVDKSTVPVGTAEKVHQAIAEVTDVKYDVVSNPEFLKEGAAVQDFLKPDRVVIGAPNDQSRDTMVELYKPFVRTNHPIVTMDVPSAEMTKYAANAMLATRITFMNEIANLCEKVGANVEMVRSGIGTDTRIGPQFLFPGVGFGGSCFPKDVQAIMQTGKEHGAPLKILEAVQLVNDAQKLVLYNKAMAYFSGDLAGKTFAVWGLAFKARTDDMREAPAIYTIRALLEQGARIQAWDPEAMTNAQHIFGDSVQLTHTQYDALKDADALLIMTEWSDFREPDFARIKKLMRQPLLFDGRNLYSPGKMAQEGFTYFSIGRP